MTLNERQRRFAELFHRYGNATRAYGEAYDCPKTETGAFPAWVSSDAHRLVRNEKVRVEIERLKGESAALCHLSLEETIDWLVQAITTPVAEIGPDSPLCEEYTVETVGPVERIKCKSVSRLGAIKELTRLTGMGAPEKKEISFGSEVVEMLAGIMGSKRE